MDACRFVQWFFGNAQGIRREWRCCQLHILRTELSRKRHHYLGAFENAIYLIEQGADVMHKDFFKRSLLKILDSKVEENAKYADDEVMEMMLWDEGKVKLAADLS